MLTSYAYASRPSQNPDDSVLQEILKSAHERNSQLGVTSVLYSDEDVYFQVIEGEEPVLAKLMSLIL
ncbi:MAG: BLUF domain-containing protein, partial [Pseudomonadota bacterium]